MKLNMVGLLGLLLIISGCGVGEGTGSTPPWASDDPPTPVADAVDDEDGSEFDADVEVIEPFQVKMETTKGDLLIQVNPEWAPRGALQFKKLVESGFYDDNRIFRIEPGFVVQFGMNGDPAVHAKWDKQPILDDRVQTSNKRGTVTFATSGPNARTTQIFINLSNNATLDNRADNFAPFGEVIEGMDVVESFNDEYGGGPSNQQPQIAEQGNAYLDKHFPGLDSVVKATVIEQAAEPSGSDETDSDGDAG